MPVISIITLTYNNFCELLKTCKSIQNVPNIEHIIINGGRCPKTRLFLDTHDGLHISESDKGISDAFNKGIRMSNGHYVVLLNSGDILLEKNYFVRAVQFLESNPGIDFVHSNEIFVDRIAGEILMTPHAEPGFFSSSMGCGMPYRHQTMIIRKSLFGVVGEFDVTYQISMDFDWICRWRRLRRRAFYFNDTPVVKMDGGGKSSVDEYDMLCENKTILKAYFPYNPAVHGCFYFKFFRFFVRRTLIRCHLNRVLKFFKVMKRKKFL